jgi:hypothetical protein
VRRIIYTTNAIEALRRAVRTRGHFPSDDAATKLLYLVLNHAAAEWKRPPREWAEAKTQFRCHVQRALRERMTDNRPHTKIPTVPGKPALIKHQRYAHAHQFKRANRSLRKLKTHLGRVIRDIGRRIDGDAELEDIFAQSLSLSRRVLAQGQRQRGPKVYSLHAPEVECIGKGKAHRP